MMKAKLNFNHKTLNLLMVVLFFTLSSCFIAQDKKGTDLKDFKIVIEKTDNGINLKSLKGCAWTDLSFSLNNHRPQAIDENGMRELKNVSQDKNKNLADFLFTITTTENEIELKGIEGTVWTELKFTLAKGKNKAINQNGMIELN